MSITRGLRWFVAMALLSAVAAASSHGADSSPPRAPGRPSTVVISSPDGGFHWADAAVGAAAMFATTLLALGLLLALRPDHRRNGKP
jgi:hypothetical protein